MCEIWLARSCCILYYKRRVVAKIHVSIRAIFKRLLLFLCTVWCEERNIAKWYQPFFFPLSKFNSPIIDDDVQCSTEKWFFFPLILFFFARSMNFTTLLNALACTSLGNWTPLNRYISKWLWVKFMVTLSRGREEERAEEGKKRRKKLSNRENRQRYIFFFKYL